jgi:hypothetical protein
LVVVFRNILVLVLLRGREEEIGAGVANKRKSGRDWAAAMQMELQGTLLMTSISTLDID